MIELDTFIQTEGGIRLDAALFRRHPSSTRAFCGEACAAGRVTVNGRPVKRKGLRLTGGERIEVRDLLEADDNRAMPDASVPLRCVYEDDLLLGFDKPAGMPVQPLSRNEGGTLANGVVARFPECATAGDGLMAGALHRIDAGTSGLVLFARTPEAYGNLRDQFAAREVKKTYLALVEGEVTEGGCLENDLIHMPGLAYCRMVELASARICETERRAARPMRAVTEYRPVRTMRVENETRTLLEVTIRTGVTHQIRAQLAIAGMHIVNDRVYGAFAEEGRIGHCLHSLAAEFRHPADGSSVRIEVPRPAWACP